ncbi:sulfatase-like hydrolase/transferase [Paenibacillus aceris]|uniref:Arylsulfatase A-like enzyme n=1 Tax=Paenibacillus aceris TaxID=869555 RepID=A0ABS4I142_9BACL|nr:sulfatase-like hydrolase/transferase [Paenibacillus aceris]MBP1964146.1 arylsulfatase A-like enzyme [Paenibacillus aceris]NHW36479.1 sulfatase-like hydrolase/transferase [Paenibacillus aceris]
MINKPNFLLIVVDEERYPPIYESPEIGAWRHSNLLAHERLRENSVELHRHYIGSAACCPSRATMFTGHYPSLHGVSQTNGIAKSAFDSDMFWLPPNTVPTMGNYFREAGYQTYYKGKWHISYEDILVPGTHIDMPSYNPATGVPYPQKEQLYMSADPLNAYGFSSWIGPEPHGRDPRNSASSAATGLSGRDVVYSAETVNLIEALDRQKRTDADAKPWLVVASFVNPHDIVLYGMLTEHLPKLFHFQVDPMPEVHAPPTIGELLNTKPQCQASYRDTYPKALQPIVNDSFYRKLYYQLQKNADQQITKVLEALILSSFSDDTIVIFTSDHGELLGAHGGLHQKMYCAYEEVLHVPFLIHNKRLFPHRQSFSELTSHVDLLPTMLGLADADIPGIQNRLQISFSEVRPFVGRDLTPYLLGRKQLGESSDPKEPVYFMTDDDITRGQHQYNPLGKAYSSVVQPNHIETVIADLPVQQGMSIQHWKYTRYFDNTQFWSVPGVRDATIRMFGEECADPSQTSTPTCHVTYKTEPVPDQYELYNLTEDPLETRNLAHPAWSTPQSEIVRLQMAHILDEQRRSKRLTPHS